jgi:tripartite-type tricarboxylate transporter receptor subunit TctC
MNSSGRALALAVMGALASSPAAAQEATGTQSYPARAIHIVVPFPARGPADIAARLIGQKMSEDWATPVVGDNRPGGNSRLSFAGKPTAGPKC